MIWIILVIVLIAGVWQLRTSPRPVTFGKMREEMDALKQEIARQHQQK